jgi:hypothetical protein
MDEGVSFVRVFEVIFVICVINKSRKDTYNVPKGDYGRII